ncbi:multicopper oxidase domain-containing protein [Nitrosomonas oligotropha]|uniref:Multicopper oxidase n=1 Tax=Nitrosomonas oligotropha TaxID=42354 RepID=A0A1H8J1Q7_9PROT|nr:multicopper oxidase domain-containing protein [Nitrosomonas oligotropha]SDW09134.1 Multicopper oxidase [Nitrosomonas oligotropha]SEN74611.1 Multicopper oxidase [Nitrosomonas oligotropha]
MTFQSNQQWHVKEFPGNSLAMPNSALLKQSLAAICLVSAMSFLPVAESSAANHIIRMTAEETRNDGFGNKLMAYKMLSHIVDGADITGRYSHDATIPGPTIVLTEGDKVEITLENAIPGAFTHTPGVSKQVSLHVHGVHYKIDSDGTLKVINNHDDEGAGDGLEASYKDYHYTWDVAPGTAGTWAYHDHNFETHNGAETRGLFGAIIVNPAGSAAYAKEYVLYLGDDAFWGMEIDGASKQQSKHGVNPSLSAAKNSDVRFHLIALGTDIHNFSLNGYKWFDPGTNKLINQAAIGPLEKHVFAVKAKGSTQYVDNNFSNKLMGMTGQFIVK